VGNGSPTYWATETITPDWIAAAVPVAARLPAVWRMAVVATFLTITSVAGTVPLIAKKLFTSTTVQTPAAKRWSAIAETLVFGVVLGTASDVRAIVCVVVVLLEISTSGPSISVVLIFVRRHEASRARIAVPVIVKIDPNAVRIVRFEKSTSN
jgi:hypothetical protein